MKKNEKEATTSVKIFSVHDNRFCSQEQVGTIRSALRMIMLSEKRRHEMMKTWPYYSASVNVLVFDP
jgi:hypothetical protein